MFYVCLHENKSNHELWWSESSGYNRGVDHAADTTLSKSRHSKAQCDQLKAHAKSRLGSFVMSSRILDNRPISPRASLDLTNVS
jgi:hypothetical protein